MNHLVAGAELEMSRPISVPHASLVLQESQGGFNQRQELRFLMQTDVYCIVKKCTFSPQNNLQYFST